MSTPSLDRVPHLVKLSRNDSQWHRENVADVLHRNNTNFPGSQPVSFARRHLKELERVDYYLAEKTDGIRLLLFSTQISGDPPVEAHFLIDRKNDYYYIQPGYLHIPRPHPGGRPGYDIYSHHVGTLLDGELVIQNIDGAQQLTYLIFDCLALHGECITDRSYDQRIQKINSGVIKAYKQFIDEWPAERAEQPFQLKAKQPGFSYAAPDLFKNVLPKLPHGNDGLIFTCRVTPYVSGTDQHILKWKPPHENTIDFRLQIGAFPTAVDDEGEFEDFDQKPDMDLQVFYGQPKGYQFYAKLHVTDVEWEAMKRLNQSFDHRIIECWREKETGHWRPKIDADGTPRFRDDKDHANHNSVVDSVLESIEDAVSQQDLEAAYNPIRNAWKEREKREKQRNDQQRQQQQQQLHHAELQKRQQHEPARIQEEEDTGPRYND